MAAQKDATTNVTGKDPDMYQESTQSTKPSSAMAKRSEVRGISAQPRPKPKKLSTKEEWAARFKAAGNTLGNTPPSTDSDEPTMLDRNELKIREEAQEKGKTEPMAIATTDEETEDEDDCMITGVKKPGDAKIRKSHPPSGGIKVSPRSTSGHNQRAVQLYSARDDQKDPVEKKGSIDQVLQVISSYKKYSFYAVVWKTVQSYDDNLTPVCSTMYIVVLQCENE